MSLQFFLQKNLEVIDTHYYNFTSKWLKFIIKAFVSIKSFILNENDKNYSYWAVILRAWIEQNQFYNSRTTAF